METAILKKLDRPEPEKQLEEGLAKPLTIITAPSGYGKTTLAKEYFAKHTEMQNIWISLGEDETDGSWLWQKICSRFEALSESVYHKLRELGFPYSTQEAERLMQMIRDNLDNPLCIVLDDYQECKSPLINELIVRLACAEIPLLHILLISRYSPDIPYEELMLKGYCSLIGQKSLTLTQEETETILKSNGVELAPEKAHQLMEYTDGWIAAVYLSLFDYRQQGYFRSLNIMNLLKKSVFHKFPDNIRRMLTAMSLFTSFYLEEAIYVTKIETEESFLRHAMEMYGFGHFDVNDRKYTMHSLLRSVALEQLEQSGIDRRELYDRDGRWQEQKGYLIPAVICYRKAGRTEKYLNLLSENKNPCIYEYAPTIFEELFRELPIEVKLHSPNAYLRYIYSVTMQHKAETGRKLYVEAQEGCRRLEEEGEDMSRVRGELLLIKSQLQFNCLDKMTECLKEASCLLNGYSEAFSGCYVMTYGVPNTLYLYHSQQGELNNVIEKEKEYTRYYMKLIQNVDGGWDELYDAEYALITGNVGRALELGEMVCEKAKFRNQTCVLISSYYTRLKCLIYLGRVQETEKVFQELLSMQNIDKPIFRIDWEIAVSIISIQMNRQQSVPEWVRNFHLEECNRFVRNVRSGCIAHGLLLIQTKQWLKLEAIAEQMMMPYESSIHLLATISAYIYKAVAVLHLEGREKALPWLSRALEIARPDNIRLPLIENGGELMPLLEELSQDDAFCAGLVRQCETYRRNVKGFTKREEKTVLTEREETVMQLVESGKQNREISDMLHIALVTVEKTLTGIYRKLEVSNRAAAVAKWTELKA